MLRALRGIATEARKSENILYRGDIATRNVRQNWASQTVSVHILWTLCLRRRARTHRKHESAASTKRLAAAAAAAAATIAAIVLDCVLSQSVRFFGTERRKRARRFAVRDIAKLERVCECVCAWMCCGPQCPGARESGAHNRWGTGKVRHDRKTARAWTRCDHAYREKQRTHTHIQYIIVSCLVRMELHSLLSHGHTNTHKTQTHTFLCILFLIVYNVSRHLHTYFTPFFSSQRLNVPVLCGLCCFCHNIYAYLPYT